MPRPTMAAALILATMACRDDVSPFEAPPRPADANAPLRHLTFSTGDDRSPIWSANGDSIYYSAEGFDHLPDEPGVLVGLPHTGGTAREILNNVSDAGRPEIALWLIAPALAPDHERLAFAHIGAPWPDPPCGLALSCTPDREAAPFPPIRRVTYRVRALQETGALENDPANLLTMPDVVVGQATVELGDAASVVDSFDIRFGPAQRLFLEEGLLYFRPSWDPNGGRIVVSDGNGLRLWTIGEPGTTAIPNTDRGVSAAWSPDGNWIAFIRIASADSAFFECAWVGGFGPCALIDYEEHTPGTRTLMLIRPDGTDPHELGPGEDPAWSPDGSTIYFRRDDSIWRMSPDGADASAIPGTQGGRDPAVSPDGNLLAFARRTARGDHDIWVLELDSSP